MPEVQNVGAVDYNQYQPSQYADNAYIEDYNTQPQIFDEQYAQMQAANKSRLGATAIATVIVAGLTGVGCYFLGKKGKGDTEAIKKELENLKNSDAVKNYENIKKGLEELEKMAEENENAFFGWMKNGKKFKEKFDEFMKPFKKTAEETKEGVEKTTEKKAEETVDAAKELEKKATDANK